MKKISLVTVTLSVLLLSGCGGGGGSDDTPSITEQMKNRHAIIVIRNYPTDKCTDAAVLTSLEVDTDAKNVISSVESNDVSCDTYGRVSNENENTYYRACLELDTELSIGKSCVFGFDDASASTAVNVDFFSTSIPTI